jgi:hypothetical protein
MKALTPPRLMIAAAAALSVLPSCRESQQARAKSEWYELEAKRVELAHKVEIQQIRLSKAEMERQGQDDIKDTWTRTTDYRANLQDYVGQLREQIAQQQEQMAALQGEWTRKMRTAAAGRTFKTLAGANGRSYQDVVITRVTDVGVEFRHATGTARLAADQLSAEQRETFALDTAVAHLAIQDESDQATAFASWVDEGVAVAEERVEEARQLALAEESNQRPVATAYTPPARPSPLASAPTSALREEARPFGNGGSIWYPTYRSYRPYRTRYYYTTPRTSYNYTPSPCRVSPVRTPGPSIFFEP